MKNASAAARGSHNHNNSSTTSSNVGINATEPRGGGGVGIIAGGRSIFHRPNSMLSVSGMSQILHLLTLLTHKFSGTTEPVPSTNSPYIGYFSASTSALSSQMNNSTIPPSSTTNFNVAAGSSGTPISGAQPSPEPQTTGSDTDLNNFGPRDEPLRYKKMKI